MYLRVSKQEEAVDESFMLETQRRRIRGLCEAFGSGEGRAAWPAGPEESSPQLEHGQAERVTRIVNRRVQLLPADLICRQSESVLRVVDGRIKGSSHSRV